MSLKHEFKYGWCYTDHKDGKEIRENYVRSDYIFGKEYRDSIEDIFDRLSLPFPDEGKVYRGTCHDMLFGKNHGLIIKVGPTDIESMINPAMLQPIGWIADKKHLVGNSRIDLINNFDTFPLGVSIYPGVKVIAQVTNKKDYVSALCEKLSELIRSTGQRSQEVNANNLGVIEVVNEEGKKNNVPILIDVDNHYNGPRSGLVARRNILLSRAYKGIDNKADAIESVLREVYLPLVGENYIKALGVHQPLRHLFWEACIDIRNPKEKLLEELWDECAELTISSKKLSYPVWKRDDKGNFSRVSVKSTDILLHKAWEYSENKFENV